MSTSIHHCDYLSNLARKGGPDPGEYGRLHELICDAYDGLRVGRLSADDMTSLRRACGSLFASTDSLFGHAFLKPYGYAGDFEIIDWMHTLRISERAEFAKWDRFAQTYPVFKAVRNRKEVLKRLLRDLEEQHPGAERLDVLNVASGPARDVYEYFTEKPDTRIHMVCVDSEPKANEHAGRLCADFGDRISFINASVLEFSADRKYDLIWSAGLFDYFSDSVFTYLVHEFLDMCKDRCEVVIGNLAMFPAFPPYIEFLDWRVYLRGEQDLLALVDGIQSSGCAVSVDQEPEGINLFLRVRRGQQRAGSSPPQRS